MYRLFIKRCLDFLMALIGLILFSPIFIVVYIILCFINNGKPFFYQSRPGKDEQIFKIVKFKTMTDKKDEFGVLLPDVNRITKVGQFIRKTSLDEIPQLLNVIKGDMSVIGPRPLLVSYLPLYSEEQAQRHQIRPGITGWAQVNGRNAITWTQKFKFDVYYVNNLSFLLDFKILFMTIKKVILKDGVNNSDVLTMPKFNGEGE